MELRQLRALYLNDTRINSIPKGFSVLNNMRDLVDCPAQMDGDLCSLQELGPLSQLSVLGINCLENVTASSFATKAMLDKKLRLSNLTLKCTNRLVGIAEEKQQQIEEAFDELCPPSCLDWLRIQGYFGRRLPRWMILTATAPLESLRILTTGDLICCTKLPDRLCQFPWLEVLHIYHGPAIKRIGPEFLRFYRRHCTNRSQVPALFPKLQELELIRMLDWEEQVQAMPIFQKLWG